MGVRTKNHKLPEHMTMRTYTNKRGQTWVGYYYMPKRDADGKRKPIPLGSDLLEAKRKWAELEGTKLIEQNSLAYVADKYFLWAECESGLAPLTVKEYRANWKFLEPPFGQMRIEDIEPNHLFKYFHLRSSKTRALKEVKFIGTLCNWARSRGYMKAQNPAQGITRQMHVQTRRTIYVTDEDFELVYQHANRIVRDAMDIAVLTGQRPSDILKMRWDDISNGVLTIVQNKTAAVVRIAVVGRLKEVIERIQANGIKSQTIICKDNGTPIRTLQGAFRFWFDRARDLAEIEAQEKGLQFNRFRFQDIRAKVATDSATQTSAQKLLGHKNITTTTIYRRDAGDVVMPLDKSFYPKQ